MANGMKPREYIKWVRDCVVDPAIKRWGKVAFERFSQAQREEIVAAECMSIVVGWCMTPGAVENAEILALYREALRQVRPDEE